MSRSGKVRQSKRHQVVAIRAAMMRSHGHTNKEIAEATGIKIETVPERVSLGERLLQLQKEG